MKQIYIEKLAEVPGGLPAIKMEEHIAGESQGDNYSIPVEYNLEGSLIYDIEVGKNVIVERTKRNGEEVCGMFTTSRVTEVGNNYFKTQNSLYSYKFL
jgi:hypothetical protein|tara:strand:- start:435 stop:728 length:294 start_codon:yes stop_codon:yes gene_type:complete